MAPLPWLELARLYAQWAWDAAAFFGIWVLTHRAVDGWQRRRDKRRERKVDNDALC